MQAVIRTEALTKFYGANRGIDGLDLEVHAGDIFGFLGPNGAGKTTTIRLLLDLIRPTGGRAQVLGHDTREGSLEIRRHIGYLPGEFSFDEALTGEQQLEYLASLSGSPDRTYRRELAERLDVDLSRRIGDLSKGNKQKIGIIQAFMHRPALLLLDEPTSGLDPFVQLEFQRLVEQASAAGQTVFLSSHVLSEVQRLATEVGIIREGRLVAVSDVGELIAQAPLRVQMQFTEPVAADAFSDLPGVHDVRVETSGDQRSPRTVLHCLLAGPADPLVKAAARYHVERFESREPELEEIFLSYYTGAPSTEPEVSSDAS